MDIVRTEAQLAVLFADNVIGAISAQAGRDLVISTFGYITNRLPTPTDDKFNSGGSGAFFDSGSNWIDTVRQRVWKCISGPLGAAVWQALCYDGQALTGVVQGSLPGPLNLTATGVVPDTYGDNTHYPVVEVGADGRVISAGVRPLPGGGTGTVTSVGLDMGPGWTITGSPVTLAGVIHARSPLMTRGDLLGFSTHDERIGAGIFGQILTPDPLSAEGLVWTYFGTVGRPGAPPNAGQAMFDNIAPGAGRCWYVAGTEVFTGVLSTASFTETENGVMFAVPFISPGGTIDKLALWVLDGDGSLTDFTWRAGIYTRGPQRAPYPQQLVADAGESITPMVTTNVLIETPGAGGFMTTPGAAYWLVLLGKVDALHVITIAGLNNCASSNNILGIVGDATSWLVFSPGIGWAMAQPYGPLPPMFPGDTTTATPLLPFNSSFIPAIGVHFQN